MTSLLATLSLQVGTLNVDVELGADRQGLAVVGPNGAGKTTLLRALVGARKPQAGSIRLGDALLFDAARQVDVAIEHRRIAYVPQEFGIFPHLSAEDNVAFALAAQGDRGTTLRHRARELLAGVGVGSAAPRVPAQLSSGEKQRVALARALAANPDAVLLDEPLSALDVEARDDMRAFLATQLARLGRPFIVVTHDREDVRALGCPVVVLESGRIVQRGSLADLERAPATAFVARFSGGQSFGTLSGAP
jgi:molybdate transport system ATP-binding protein